MLEILQNIDTQIYLFFNGLHSPFFDSFMMSFTGKYIWAPMYAAILFILFRLYRPAQAAVYTIGIILAIFFADQVCATLIRPVVARLRPSNLENPLSQLAHVVNNYRGGSYGFPSCHAANSFALAVFLACLNPRRRFVIFILGWAALNSYSRLYLGVHYPGDLLVGAVIGSGIGFSMWWLSRYAAVSILPGRDDDNDRPADPLPYRQISIAGMTARLHAGDIMIGIAAIIVASIVMAALMI